jgi:arylsulfatase A-like enzyme
MMARGEKQCRKDTRMKKAFGQMLTRREFLKVAGAGALGASLLGAGCDVTERLPNLPVRPPAGDRNTNVVVIIIDSLRKDHVGAYGNSWIKTPNLDALSKESLRFTRAYPESLPTICARRAIHTGIRTWPFRDWHDYKGVDFGVWGWQPIPEGQPHLAEIMRKNGYTTLLVTDTLHQYVPTMNFQRGFDAFEFIRGQTTDGYKPIWTFPPEQVEQALGLPAYFQQYFANTAYRKSEEDWFSPQVFTKASEFLELVKEAQPFFLVVDNYDPHPPNDPPEEYVSLYDEPYGGLEPYSPRQGPSTYLTDRQLRRMSALYSGEVTMMDRWLGHFLEKMDELKLFDSTLLIVISDHGVAHGEHGIVGKPTHALWPEVTDVPFFIRHPDGKGAGEATDHYASTHDVAPTILGFLGIESPEVMEGQDLSVLLDGAEPASRPHFTLGYNDWAWARDEDYVMFARNDGANPRLYDVREDPEMKNDIAGERPDVVKSMFDDYILKDAGGLLPQYY